MSLTSSQILLKRFAGRLNSALDALGAPALPLDRARFFGGAIEQDAGNVSAMLNGYLMPDWDTLLKICTITNRQPGFFLDDSITQYPPETRLVKPLGTGENIVIRVPGPDADGTLTATDNQWSYVVAKSKMGFGVQPGDFVINCTPAKGTVSAKQNWLYLMWSASKFEILKCVDVHPGRSTFSGMSIGAGAGMHKILPLDSDGHSLHSDYMEEAGIEHLGIIAMTTRSAQIMTRL
jgi:hypothetical protein